MVRSPPIDQLPSRWSPAVGAVWCALMVVLNAPFIVHDLSNPADIVNFVFNLWTVPLLMLGIVAGIAARIRGVGRPAPTWLGSALIAGVGVLFGGSVVAIMPRPSGAELSPALLANSVHVNAQHMAFDQTVVHVRVGEPAIVQLTNADGVEHSFDIDALDVHTYHCRWSISTSASASWRCRRAHQPNDSLRLTGGC